VERAAALITQERLIRMKEDKNKFIGDLNDQRKEEFKVNHTDDLLRHFLIVLILLYISYLLS